VEHRNLQHIDGLSLQIQINREINTLPFIYKSTNVMCVGMCMSSEQTYGVWPLKTRKVLNSLEMYLTVGLTCHLKECMSPKCK
jgi:hypothetical protein